MDVFEKRVAAAIDRYAMLSGAQKVLVALSGGPDSVAVLRVLLALSKQSGRAYRVRAAHVNHQLRGEQSQAEERFVVRLCARHKIGAGPGCRFPRRATWSRNCVGKDTGIWVASWQPKRPQWQLATSSMTKPKLFSLGPCGGRDLTGWQPFLLSEFWALKTKRSS